MIKHYCDMCSIEIFAEKSVFFRKFELCEFCAENVENFIMNEPIEAANSNADMPHFVWHDINDDLPEKDGIFLVTLEFKSISGITHQVRIAKFDGLAYWYKMNRNNAMIEESGGNIIAWAEIPEPFEKEGAE